MAMSVLTSHVFGPAKLISDAGGTEPAKFNIQIDPFAIWTDPFAKCSYIYIYMSESVLSSVHFCYKLDFCPAGDKIREGNLSMYQ